MDVGLLLVAVGGVLAISVLVALGAARAGVPFLVVFLGLGMLLGSDGPGGIKFDDVELARTVGVVGLAAIVFEGGLSTSLRGLRAVVVSAASLSTVGVAVTAGLTGGAAHLLFHLPWAQSFLLGAVVSSTDAAAVFATLRSTAVRHRLARVLEAETGLNDPVAIALTLGLISLIEHPNSGLGELAIVLVRQLGLGAAIGVAFALLARWVFVRLPASVGVFAPVASVAAAALAFGATDLAGGSGFLAVYLVGVAVGSSSSRYRHQVVAFHEGLAFLAQVVLFVVFGLLVFPHELGAVAGPALVLTLLLIVVIRPVAVWAATVLNPFTARERLLLGWAGLRGAAPIVLATLALSARIDRATTVFNGAFFVVVASTLLQGTTLEPLARGLGLVEPGVAGRTDPLTTDAAGPLEMAHFDVTGDHVIAGSLVSDVGLPHHALIAVISRGTETIPPRGSTRIEPGDRLSVLVPRSEIPELEDLFTRWRRPSSKRSLPTPEPTRAVGSAAPDARRAISVRGRRPWRRR